jgi:hypothetical protein
MRHVNFQLSPHTRYMHSMYISVYLNVVMLRCKKFSNSILHPAHEVHGMCVWDEFTVNVKHLKWNSELYSLFGNQHQLRVFKISKVIMEWVGKVLKFDVYLIIFYVSVTFNFRHLAGCMFIYNKFTALVNMRVVNEFFQQLFFHLLTPFLISLKLCCLARDNNNQVCTFLNLLQKLNELHDTHCFNTVGVAMMMMLNGKGFRRCSQSFSVFTLYAWNNWTFYGNSLTTLHFFTWTFMNIFLGQSIKAKKVFKLL